MEGTADRKRTAEESRSVNKDDTAAVGRKRTAEESESVNEDDKHDRSNSNKRRHVQESAVIPREPSIFRVRPVDDIIKYVADFIAKHCSTENVEIEAKLGVIIDKRTNQRINLGAFTETVIPLDYNRYTRFESNMPLQQHRHFNRMLNKCFADTQASGYRGERITYKHTKETDRFYENTGHRAKWRVTTDQKTGEIVPNGIVEKIRMADLDIHSPTQPLDYRISINLEIPRPKPTTSPVYERNKDRISYVHGGINFDLTQVKGAAETDLRHELELEFIDPQLLSRERRKLEQREPSQYMDMIEVFVNNIRMLSRNALRL